MTSFRLPTPSVMIATMATPRTPGFNADPPPLPTTHVVKPDNTIVLRGHHISLTSDVGAQFVIHAARNREKIFSDARLREKYSIDSDADWTQILANKPLRLAVSQECERRVLSGAASQEAAAAEFVKAPTILGSILENERNSPRHRIDAAKTLHAVAHPADEKPGIEKDRISIVINMGENTKPIVIDAPANPVPPRNAPDAENDPW